MNVGIITFHRTINIGAVLQASALNSYIEEKGIKCEIIDFIPNNEIPDLSIIHKVLHYLRCILTLPTSIQRKKKKKKFLQYIDEYITLSNEVYYGDKDEKLKTTNYDVLVSGSDQILNTALTGNSKAYYLDFFNGKKISYASSFGRKNVSKEETELIRNELPKFAALSVREQSGADIIKREIGKEPQLVMDPVFLLSKDEWCKRCNEELKLPEKYIFVYSMEVSPVLENVVSTIKKKTGLPIKIVRGGGKPGLIEGNEDSTCGPEEFLRYIRDAELVITNSFHGTAFSLIFEKKFLCIAHSTRNARLENILHLIEQDEKMIFNLLETYSDKVICGDKSISNLERLIDLSKDYLTQNIGKS